MERKIPMSAAERKRLSRQRLKKKMAEKMSESEVATAKQNERERVVKAVKKTRENKKATMSSDDLKAYKLSESARVNKIQKEKREAIKMDREKAAEALVSIANRKVVQPYKTRQSFSKALKSAREALPSSPRKRAAVISGLASEVGMRMESNFIKSLTSSAREEVRNYVREFYYRADISYTAPGMKEEMTVWDENGKRQLRKYYLTMFLREAYRVFIDTADKEFHCSRSVFCALRPQNVLLLNDSPKDQCKCQTHENFFMKLEAMGHSYSGLFWGTILCDLTPNSDCWTNKCEECKDGKRFVPLKELTAMTNYKQWNFVEVESRKPKKPKVAENDEKKETYTKLVQSVQEVQVQVVLNEFQEQFESITAHVNVKRIQEKEFQADLNNADVRVLQIDYTMAYQCENQNEVYGALCCIP